MQRLHAGTGAASPRGRHSVLSVSVPDVATGHYCMTGNPATAGQCAGTLGGFETACFEANSSSTLTNWAYVGDNRGAYLAVPAYGYVGEGCGNFNLEVIKTYQGWRFRKCCVSVGSLLLALTVICILVFALLYLHRDHIKSIHSKYIDAGAAVPTVTSTSSPTEEPYRCWSGGLWSTAKKRWCCLYHQKGCLAVAQRAKPPVQQPTRPPQLIPHPVPVPVPVPAPVPIPVPQRTSLPFDCNEGFKDCYKCLLQRWSTAKRAWCCLHARRGCPEEAAPPQQIAGLPFDCDAGFPKWQQGWSVRKKAWCCQHARKGCPQVTTPCPPQDCTAAFSNWRAAWTREKKAWCCQHENKGCPEETSSTSPGPPQDCAAAFGNWRKAWAPAKKQWCCQHEGKGCERI